MKKAMKIDWNRFNNVLESTVFPNNVDEEENRMIITARKMIRELDLAMFVKKIMEMNGQKMIVIDGFKIVSGGSLTLPMKTYLRYYEYYSEILIESS